MSDSLDRATLMATIDRDRARLETAVRRVPPGRLEEPGLGEWSVKDVLAHVAFWDADLLARVEAAARGDAPPASDPDFEAVNRREWAASRRRSLAEVRQVFDQTHRKLRERLATLPVAILAAPAAPGAPDGPALWQTLGGASFEHYREHADAIEGWLGRTST